MDFSNYKIKLLYVFLLTYLDLGIFIVKGYIHRNNGEKMKMVKMR